MEAQGSLARTLKLYWGYCVLNGVFYLGLALYLVWESKHTPAWFTQAVGPDNAQFVPDWFVPLVFGTFALVSFIFALGNFGLPYMKPKKSSWVIHFINLLLGLTSCYLTLPAAALLYFWFKPEVMEYYKVR